MSTAVNAPRRRTRRSSQPRRRLGTIAFAIGVVAVLSASLFVFRHPPSDDAVEAGSEAVVDRSVNSDLVASAFTGRPTYRHSVIPGGAYDEVELRTAITRDAVVAAHYRDLDESRIRVETVARDRRVYVSYRKNNQIFWTKNKVLLRQGETILTDGKTQIRTRCGNCISEEPQLPTAQDEPETVEFDRLVDSDPTPEPEEPLVALAPSDSPAPFGSSAPFGLSGGVPGTAASIPSFPGGLLGDGAPSPLAAGRRPGSGGEPGSPSVDAVTPLAPRPTPPRIDPPFPGWPGQPPGNPDTPLAPPELWVPPTSGITPQDLPPDYPDTTDEPTNPVPVPEPGTLLLLGGGAAVLWRVHGSRRERGSNKSDDARGA